MQIQHTTNLSKIQSPGGEVFQQTVQETAGGEGALPESRRAPPRGENRKIPLGGSFYVFPPPEGAERGIASRRPDIYPAKLVIIYKLAHSLFLSPPNFGKDVKFPLHIFEIAGMIEP